MKNNTKSSITLPVEELALVLKLQKTLKIKTKVEVVRKGLKLLEEHTDRKELRKAFLKASEQVRASLKEELKNLDHLSGEGLD
jgi:hypothetical protein